jgi:hypothetical protein
LQQQVIYDSRTASTQTECTPKQFEFEEFDRRQVVADFYGGDITSNAGALLLDQLDRSLGLTSPTGAIRALLSIRWRR